MNNVIIHHCDGTLPKIFKWNEETRANYHRIFGELSDRGQFVVLYDTLEIDMYSTTLNFPNPTSFFRALALASVFDDRFEEISTFPIFASQKRIDAILGMKIT